MEIVSSISAVRRPQVKGSPFFGIKPVQSYHAARFIARKLEDQGQCLSIGEVDPGAFCYRRKEAAGLIPP